MAYHQALLALDERLAGDEGIAILNAARSEISRFAFRHNEAEWGTEVNTQTAPSRQTTSTAIGDSPR